jgi:hypothetical protein
MNYSRQIAWAVILGILNAIAPSVSAQSGGHTQGSGHIMVTPDDLTWVDVPSHCTGWKAIPAFAREFPEAFVQGSVGTRLVIESGSEA